MNNGGIYTEDKCLITTQNKSTDKIQLIHNPDVSFLVRWWKILEQTFNDEVHIDTNAWKLARSHPPLNITSFPNFNLLGSSNIFLEEILTLKKIISFLDWKKSSLLIKNLKKKRNWSPPAGEYILILIFEYYGSKGQIKKKIWMQWSLQNTANIISVFYVVTVSLHLILK